MDGNPDPAGGAIVPEPPSLVEVQIREEIREEMIAADQAAENRDKRIFALVVTGTLAVLIVLPLAGAVVGLMVRAFLWAAGF